MVIQGILLENYSNYSEQVTVEIDSAGKQKCDNGLQ